MSVIIAPGQSCDIETATTNSAFLLTATYYENGVVVDLSTYTAKMLVKTKDLSITILTFQTTDGTISLNNMGVIIWEQSLATMAAVVPGQYVYDFLLIPPSGLPIQIIPQSNFIVKKGVS